MGFLGRLFGGDKKEERGKMGAGAHQMQPTSMSMSGMKGGGGMDTQHSGSMSGMKTAKDPVCGMDVNPEKAAATSTHQGTTYFFCAPGCKRAFDQDPARYLGGSGQMKQGMHGGKHHGGCC